MSREILFSVEHSRSQGVGNKKFEETTFLVIVHIGRLTSPTIRFTIVMKCDAIDFLENFHKIPKAILILIDAFEALGLLYRFQPPVWAGFFL